MHIMAYWRWDNYQRGLDKGVGFHFSSNQGRLHSLVEIGEHLWLVTGRKGPTGTQYFLVARLAVAAKTHNPPNYTYGCYRLEADVGTSLYFCADDLESSDLLLALHFAPRKPIHSRSRIGQSLQTIRALTVDDDVHLLDWGRNLNLEPRAHPMAQGHTYRRNSPSQIG